MHMYFGDSMGDWQTRARRAHLREKNALHVLTTYSTNLAQWFGGVMGIPPTEFLSLYGSQSGRNGEA